MILNLDWMLMPDTRIAYILSLTSNIAQKYIVPKIQARFYQNWTKVFQDLKTAFSNLDTEFFA